MKLFNEFNKHEHEFPTQFKPLLLRLSVMEGVAASKFIHNKPVHDPERELLVLENIRIKCIDRGFSQSKIDLLHEFFKNNMALAKLIQEAYLEECRNKPNDEVLDVAITSIIKVTNKSVNKETLLASIRIFIDGLTEEVIQNIEFLSDDNVYDFLEQIIVNCFSHIDIIQLGQVIKNFKVDMKKYQQKDPDTCQIDFSTNRDLFFNVSISLPSLGASVIENITLEHRSD